MNKIADELASAETRATYVAISNTLIGVAMLFGAAIGIIADVLDIHYLILFLGLLGLAAAVYAWAWQLPEVSHWRTPGRQAGNP